MSPTHPVDTLTMLPMRDSDLDEVLALELAVYPYPWSRLNFADSLNAGYDAWVARDETGDRKSVV